MTKLLLHHHFRHALAALHFNFNLNREVKKNDDGTTQLAVHYPKFKNGEATIKDIRVQQNFGKFILFVFLVAENLFQGICSFLWLKACFVSNKIFKYSIQIKVSQAIWAMDYQRNNAAIGYFLCSICRQASLPLHIPFMHFRFLTLHFKCTVHCYSTGLAQHDKNSCKFSRILQNLIKDLESCQSWWFFLIKNSLLAFKNSLRIIVKPMFLCRRPVL